MGARLQSARCGLPRPRLPLPRLSLRSTLETPARRRARAWDARAVNSAPRRDGTEAHGPAPGAGGARAGPSAGPLSKAPPRRCSRASSGAVGAFLPGSRRAGGEVRRVFPQRRPWLAPCATASAGASPTPAFSVFSTLAAGPPRAGLTVPRCVPLVTSEAPTGHWDIIFRKCVVTSWNGQGRSPHFTLEGRLGVQRRGLRGPRERSGIPLGR